MDFEVKKFENLQYVVNYPDSYSAAKKYPVIIFLHGAGTRFTSTDHLMKNPYFEIIRSHGNFPFISVAPLCMENSWFDLFETLKRFAVYISNEDYADSSRIYLMGISMGGYGTWALAMSMPELFAAIVPVCGGGMYWNAATLANVPVWAFHGGKDITVFPEESQKMVDAVNKNGGNAKLTIYPENAHDSWSDTYRNYEVFRWLLSNTNKNENAINDIYDDSKIYG